MDIIQLMILKINKKVRNFTIREVIALNHIKKCNSLNCGKIFEKIHGVKKINNKY